MRKIINNKCYDTETAIMVGEGSPVVPHRVATSRPCDALRQGLLHQPVGHDHIVADSLSRRTRVISEYNRTYASLSPVSKTTAVEIEILRRGIFHIAIPSDELADEVEVGLLTLGAIFKADGSREDDEQVIDRAAEGLASVV